MPEIKDEILKSQEDINSDDGINEIVDVDFDFYPVLPIDFHGLKQLLKQTLGEDHTFVSLSAVADSLINQSTIGTVVKVDEYPDPYAIISAIPFEPSLLNYITQKTLKHPQHTAFVDIINSKSTYFLANDRLINMPPQIIPPMLSCLLTEINAESALDIKYFIMISKVYRLVHSTIDEEEQDDQPQPLTKSKKRKRTDSPIFYFQSEDEIIQKYAQIIIPFELTNQEQSSDSRRAFQDSGIQPSRNILVLPFSVMPSLLSELETALKI